MKGSIVVIVVASIFSIISTCNPPEKPPQREYDVYVYSVPNGDNFETYVNVSKGDTNYVEMLTNPSPTRIKFTIQKLKNK